MDDETLRERLNEEPSMEAVRKFFADRFKLADSSEEKTKLIEDLTFKGLLEQWNKKGFKRIITMVGAGISTSAGIPDFRSPGYGLYDNLQKYNLPHPTSIFEMDYFRVKPEPFFALAKELYPGTFNPTPAHYFVRMLHEKDLLVRHYTQNIDTLERIAGIPNEKLVEAHGTFYTNHCLGCRKLYTMEWMKERIFADKLPICSSCKAVVKPDIVFFGENMPEVFYTRPMEDFKNCDLLIIMGTSLEVQPFASLIDKAGSKCMRLLINRDKVGSGKGSWFTYGPGLLYDSPDNTRDVAFIGDCDDGVYEIADALGWGDELRAMIQSEHERLEKENEEHRSPDKKLDKSDPGKEEDKKKETMTSSEAKDSASGSGNNEKATSSKADAKAA